jgi:very-short-patch-repair endonuclease
MKFQYISYNPKLLEAARENRKNQTPAEKKMWSILQNRQLGNYKFLRQKPLNNFIADFYCAELMLVVEVDGDSHIKKREYDMLRSEKLEQYGIKVIRYRNKEIMLNIEKVRKNLINKLLPLIRGRSGGGLK